MLEVKVKHDNISFGDGLALNFHRILRSRMMAKPIHYHQGWVPSLFAR